MLQTGFVSGFNPAVYTAWCYADHGMQQ